MKENKREVTVDGKVYTIVRPGAREQSQATIVQSKSFANAVASGAPAKSQLRKLMESNGDWSDKHDDELKDIKDKLFNAEKQLAKGAKSGLNKAGAKKLALDMRGWRNRLLELTLLETQYDSLSAESIADNAKFDYLVSVSVFDEEGNKIFKDVDDYVQKSEEEFAVQSAKALGELLYGSMVDFGKEFPENLFLKKYNFVNDKGSLVNSDGHLVDTEGRLINEQGFYVDEAGNRLDRDGNKLDEHGNIVDPEFEEFTD